MTMKSNSKSNIIIRLIGIIFVLMGLSLNQFTWLAFFDKDGFLSIGSKFIILLFELFFVLIGIIFLILRKKSSKYFFKNIVFALIPLMIMITLIELSGRFFYFNYVNDDIFVIQPIYRKLKRSFILWRAKDIAKHGLEIRIPDDILYLKQGEKLLTELMDKYEQHFIELKTEVDIIDANFSVLYIPSHSKGSKIGSVCHIFFKKLAEKYNVDFIDFSNDFFSYDFNVVTLSPENGHLSRFCNKLVADKIKDYLDVRSSYHSNHTFKSPPKLLGDLQPNRSETWTIVNSMPYNVTTNSQGFRMSYDLIFPKQKQRVLILGDSVTFGPYLANHNTFPNLLAKKLNHMEIINAGIAGYTIHEETALFKERAKFTNPDFVILQVLDNDIHGLTTYELLLSPRFKHIRYSITDAEKELLESRINW